MMEGLALLAISFVGSTLWVFNAEATAAVYGAQMDWPPLAVGVVAATGQACAYVLFYLGGDALVERWGWLHDKVARTRRRFRDHLERRYLILTGVSALVGLPPVVAVAALAPGFGIPLHHLLAVAFTLRVVRFSTLAWLGDRVLQWLSWG